MYFVTYTYDERDRLQRSADAATDQTITYTYDVYGNLAGKTEPARRPSTATTRKTASQR